VQAETTSGIGERIRALCAIGPRGSATPAEVRAADQIVSWMRELGAQDVAREDYRFQRSAASRYLLHYALLLAGSLLGLRWPAAGLVVSLATLASFYGELSFRFRTLADALLPRLPGANAHGRIPPRAGGPARRTVVLIAHHDTQKAGLLFHHKVQRAFVRLARRPEEENQSPFGLSWWMAVLQTALLGLFTAGIAWPVPRLLLVAPAIAAAGGALVMIQWMASPHVLGANDNASGVALILEVGARLAKEPLERTEVRLVSAGCEESGLGGSRAFFARHARVLDPRTTLVVAVDTIAGGQVRYTTDEHMMGVTRSSPELIGHMEALARSPEHAHVRPFSLGLFSDARSAMVRGYGAMMITAWDLEWVIRNYHQPTDDLGHLDLVSADRTLAVIMALLARIDDSGA